MALPGGTMEVRSLEGSHSGSKTCRDSRRTAGQNSLSSGTKGKAPGARALGCRGEGLTYLKMWLRESNRQASTDMSIS